MQTPLSPNYGTVRVSITNACGTSGYSGITFYPGYNCGGYYTLYPNPASDIVNIAIDEKSPVEVANDSVLIINETIKSDNDKSFSFTVKIYNNHGMLMRNFTRTGSTFAIPVSYLENGIYIIEIHDGKTAYRQQLIIKRN